MRVRAAALLVLLGSLVALLPAGAAPRKAPPPATCFWEGPVHPGRLTTRGFDGRNFNFPEESATYWIARFHLPDGAKLVISGRYPHGRYESLNSYSDGAPTDTLSDINIAPDRGSTNPFITGHRRDRARRSWHVTVVDAPVPAQRARNTLYAQPAQGKPIELALRVYEPDRGLDLTGGVGLPRVRLVLAHGTAKNGTAACAAINDPDRSIPVQTISPALWKAGYSAPGCDPQTAPAYDPVRWERFFNIDYASLAVPADCTPAGRAARLAAPHEQKGGFYSNRDSAYIYAHLSRKFGPVLTVRATLPRFPHTKDGQRRMGGGDLRFWSLCSGESRVTVRTPDCLADRQVPLGPGRRYLIVMSRRADRPANATARCGVAWLDWGNRGDGAGRPDYGLLIMRNMLVSPRFAHAIQRVKDPGTEPAVMGRYFPRSAYTTTAAFAARGCAGARRLRDSALPMP